ncbi:MAG TPA: tetratricopeptide repeat protein [Bryobacteraceae bacterium]|nr:tetratricopeptide repeat protein [Bryobacteraceae bacterium]
MHVAVIVLGLAWQAVSPDVVQHAKAGLAAKQQGRLADAIVEFKKVTELAPDLPAGFVNLGAAYMDTKQYDEAIAPLERAIQLNPDLPGAEQMLGYALLSEGYAKQAIPHFEKAHAEDGLGIAQLETGNLAAAVADLEAALAKHPNDPDVLYYLGRASGLLSKDSFDALQSNYPDSARAHQALGENYAVLRRVPEAEKEYEEALRLRPDARGIHLALGQLYAGAQQWPKAAEQFAAEAKLQPGSAEAAYRLGNALLEEGKIKAARTELARADHLRPDMPETLYALGKAASLDGDPAAAISAWNKVVAFEKNSPLAAQAHFGLAKMYRQQGKSAEAQREMQEFQKLQKP